MAQDGSVENPWQVSSYTDLKKVGTGVDDWNMDDYYIQTADINASASATENSDGSGGYYGFLPIGGASGTSYTAFIGQYDGDGYTISNLYINRTADRYGGLFAYLGASVVKNIGIVNCDITGKDYTGALVGYAIDSSTIQNCYSTGEVTGTTYVGGLIGYGLNGTIQYSYSSVNVTSSASYSGGFIGQNRSTTSNCYATGEVTGTTYVGGFVGRNYNASLSYCYSTGKPTGIEYVGGFCGFIYGGSYTENYWDINTSETETSAHGTGKTTTQMKDIDTYVGNWDMVVIGSYADEDWYIDDGVDYPHLGWEYDPFNYYGHRYEFTIDHTKIDADLSWFPVTVFLTSSQGEEVFTEFDADEDFDRVAFTNSDETTQLYAECERFDVASKVAIYHVSKTGWTISSSADTKYYMYFDNTADHNTTYVSKNGGTAAQNVWKTSYAARYDMDDAYNKIDLQLKEHHYTDTVASPEIDFSITSSVLKINSTTGGLGRGYAFANFTNDYLDGKKISITYNTYSAYSSMPFLGIITDGSYDRTSATDFPSKANYLTKGNGTLNTIFSVTGTNASTTVTTAVLDLSGGSQTDVCVMMYIGDQWNIQDGYLEISKFEILDSNDNVLKQVYFDKSAVSMESTGGTDDYGLLSYEGVLDSTSNANHGTKFGSTEATGQVGQGQDFDGSDDYIDLGDLNTPVLNSGKITISALVKFNSFTGSQPIFVDGGSVRGYEFGIYNGELHLAVENNNSHRSIGYSTANLSTGTWYHVTAVLDGGNGYLDIYVNGVNVATDHSLTAFTDFNGTLGTSIGATKGQSPSDNTANYYYFDGVIDNVEVIGDVSTQAWIGATYSSFWDTLQTSSYQFAPQDISSTNILFIFSNF